MAKVYSPPGITKKVLVAFSKLFNSVTIKDKSGNDYVVPIKLGTAEKIFQLTQITDEDRNRYKVSLPLLGFNITGVSFDSNRTFSQQHTLRSTDSTEVVRQPVPYNFNISLTCICNRASELFEIFELLVTDYQQARYFPLVEYKFTDGSEIIRDYPIELTSDSMEIKTESTDGEDQTFSFTLEFMVKGYLHHPYVTVPEGGEIRHIDIAFEESIDETYRNIQLVNNASIDEAGNLTIT